MEHNVKYDAHRVVVHARTNAVCVAYCHHQGHHFYRGFPQVLASQLVPWIYSEEERKKKIHRPWKYYALGTMDVQGQSVPNKLSIQ